MDIRAAKTMTTPTLASSEGWKLIPNRLIQRLAPFSVVPIRGTRISRNREPARTKKLKKRKAW